MIAHVLTYYNYNNFSKQIFSKCKSKYPQINYKYVASIMMMAQSVRDYLSKRMEFLVFYIATRST